MAAVRFDTSPIKGREVLSAKLYLHPIHKNNQLRYIRLSTINQDWVEGESTRPYGPGNGATYNHTDSESKRPWSWAGSQFCDVSFSSGQTLSSWAEREIEEDGWVSVDVDPNLIYAMAVGDTDGLAIQDGGTPNLFNNFIHSRESGRYAPYIMVSAGRPLKIVPDTPRIEIEPDPSSEGFDSGAAKIKFQEDKKVFYWKVKINHKPVDRWRIKHPESKGPTTFSIDDLLPSQKFEVEVVALSRSGHKSEPAISSIAASPPPSKKIKFRPFKPPLARSEITIQEDKMRVWALPGLVKVSPLKPMAIYKDMGDTSPSDQTNAVWNGKRVSLFGIRGEYVDFQICIEKLDSKLTGIKVNPHPLRGPGDSTIGVSEIELFKNWYSRTREDKWRPAYLIPLKHGQPFQLPDPLRGISNQENQTIYVDVYIPKKAKPGRYMGKIEINAVGLTPISIPIELKVHDFLMPDKLAFWPEMNAYHIPKNVHDYYRLAHQNRCVANFWVIRPRLSGSGKNIKIHWNRYDKIVGPLLSGRAFSKNRRSGRPTECLYLPFEDSWPTPLTKRTYGYDGYWPKRGDNRKTIDQHYLKSPYIDEALSREYKDAFLAVQKQFIEHFKEKGWTNTEMQCFFGGKNTHRTDYGANMWWTTDEPYHWDDWLALQFFTRLWTKGRETERAPSNIWSARADISRPQWQGRILDGIVDTVYYGGFKNQRIYRRCDILARDTGIKIMAYGSANAHDRSNTETVVLTLNMWLNGANGFLPWQTIGNERSLDRQESCSGNALFVPGDKFGYSVVGDMRLKAFRKGEQLIEYMVMLGRKYNLNRKQIKHMVHKVLSLKTWRVAGTELDNADALTFSSLKAWQISELRRMLLELIEASQDISR